MKSAKAAITATKNVVSFPLTRERREKDELAFLPAALEIVETPPSPIGRAIGATLIALFCLALIWASFGHVDIVASATGKSRPERPGQADTAVRDRRRTRHSRSRWPERQSG